VRPGVTFNNGDAFTAEDVAANFTGWCDSTVEGNSMATRMGGLVDPDTGVAREGAIQVIDDMTVQINLPVLGHHAGARALRTIPPRSSTATTSAPTRSITGSAPAPTASPSTRSAWARLEKNPDHTYWGDAYLDEVRFIDLGQDPPPGSRAPKPVSST
jgi:peptide/nickel transport system substrate-binding protein